MPDFAWWCLAASLIIAAGYLWLIHLLDEDGYLHRVVWRRYLRPYFKGSQGEE